MKKSGDLHFFYTKNKFQILQVMLVVWCICVHDNMPFCWKVSCTFKMSLLADLIIALFRVIRRITTVRTIRICAF